MLSTSQLDIYRNKGYVVVPGLLSQAETARVRAEAEYLFGRDHPGRVMENDGLTVRGIHGCHQVSPLLARLARLSRVLSAAEQVLGSRVYVHQSKVNAKRALRGDLWPWHQDYIFWEREDGMPEPRVTNVAFFLDDVTPHNGPLLLLPGSQHLGVVAPQRREAAERGWEAHLSADLAYALDAARLAPLAEKFGIEAATGEAGSALMFDPRLIHGSGTNMSPVDRTLLLLTYNSIHNVPRGGRRPTFLAERDATPLRPVEAL
ncbi:phytanoyl-CoA dioxygenase family protein [Streptomyces johnsoniae]|uniref:Phytanoyl-CoA dioxygenase family protein n=1 Tax=Streptomyces johnsoniae TaxID=3075532 RepID=A0ABU2S6C0_9ACTN|nr:phytanoyl-CoA dioxygenase family protein [Streptomyces sp. DSM 41886]MDT0444521.1 phytanoyl-CoA dioxygenase family protein [Streptomyces sp. DSM 41886]